MIRIQVMYPSYHNPQANHLSFSARHVSPSHTRVSTDTSISETHISTLILKNNLQTRNLKNNRLVPGFCRLKIGSSNKKNVFILLVVT